MTNAPKALAADTVGPLLVGRAFVDLEPTATGRRHCRLLEDLGHDAGTDRAAAFADGETQTSFVSTYT